MPEGFQYFYIIKKPAKKQPKRYTFLFRLYCIHTCCHYQQGERV